jgi:hypothetical protein
MSDRASNAIRRIRALSKKRPRPRRLVWRLIRNPLTGLVRRNRHRVHQLSHSIECLLPPVAEGVIPGSEQPQHGSPDNSK